MNKQILFAALAVLATVPLLAGTARLDIRQQQQRARIHNGVTHGELTRLETRRLAAGQVHLNRVEARARSDGRVTRRERTWMHHEAAQQSRRIHRQKHDAQNRN